MLFLCLEHSSDKKAPSKAVGITFFHVSINTPSRITDIICENNTVLIDGCQFLNKNLMGGPSKKNSSLTGGEITKNHSVHFRRVG